MPTAIINGRRVQIPEVANLEDIRKAGEIEPGRGIVHRRREGNYALRPDEEVHVTEGDVFLGVPPHIKG